MGIDIPAQNRSEITPEQKKVNKMLKQKRKKEALTYLIKLCQDDVSAKLYEEILLKEFYYPHAASYRAHYEENRRILGEYPYFRAELSTEVSELDFLLLKCDEEYYKYDILTKKMEKIMFPHPQDTLNTRAEEGKVIFLSNYYHFKKIFKIEIENRKDNKIFPWMKDPLYLYYDNIALLLPYMQCFDFSLLLKSERVVFLFGKPELSRWFENIQVKLPDVYLNLDDNDDIIQTIMTIKLANDKEYWENKRKVSEYYSDLSKQDLYNRLISGKPRIVFFTGLASTATQYYIRDLARACNRLQIPNRVIREQGNLFRVTSGDLFRILNDFHPDIFIVINDFRYQHPYIPANMLYFNWAMDPYERMSYDSAEKTTDLDFILDIWISNKQSLLTRGHPEERIIEGPIIVPDAELFREYDLSEEEQREYGCDICLFSNSGNPKEGLENFLKTLRDSPIYSTLEKLYTAAYEGLYHRFYAGDWLYSDDEYRTLLEGYRQEYNLSLIDEHINATVSKFRELVGWVIMRSIPMEWLHEKGYDMKLWGKAWLNHPTLSKYAQGVAENGEKLAKVIKASKIVIGTNSVASAHPRVFETFLSGGLYMGVNIPAQHDYADVRRFLEEDKEIVFFYNKEDLFRKVDYYLENEERRKEVIKNSQKKIRSKVNYDTFFPQILAEVAVRLKRQIDRDRETEVKI